MKSSILVAALLCAPTLLFANEPDSAYIFAFATTANNNKNGLQFAWSTDAHTWHEVGSSYSFLKCDYGTWGAEKRMLAPILARTEGGAWQCLWRVNERDSVIAQCASNDLVSWTVQEYRPLAARENAPYFANMHRRQAALVNGSQQMGTAHKVAWSTINFLLQAQQLADYRSALYGEQAKDDAARFANLKPLRATLAIDTASRTSISTQLIGVFFEDINYAADGGLYAELVQNRDFEYDMHDKKGRDSSWNAMHSWTKTSSSGAFAIDTGMPIHANNPHYAVLRKTGICNAGFDGIAVAKGERYSFSTFAKMLDGRKANVHARLVNDKGDILAEAETKNISNTWKKYSATLIAKQGCDKARLMVYLSDSMAQYALDMVSLFPQKTFRNRPNGLRADLAQAIADISPRFVRFPGGCVAHGDGLNNIYRWKNTIGTLESRKPQRNIWNYHQSAGLGYFEYFQFCEDIGAEPLPVLAAGVPCQNSSDGGAGQQGGIPMPAMDEYVQDVLDLIEWANGDARSHWGSKRAAAGHPAPFNLKYVGIGNEDLISDIFKERFQMLFEAVHKRYPNITVIGTAGPFCEGADYTEGWKFATHLRVPIVDEHYYQPPAWFIYNQDFYDRYDRAKPHVYLGEYAAHLPGRPNNLETALAEALYLTALERNADVVRFASYAPLLAKERRTQWNPNLIYFNNTEVKPTVGYHVQRLFGNNAGSSYVANTLRVDVRNPKARARIGCSVVQTDSGATVIKLVNMLPVPVEVAVDNDFSHSARIDKTTMQGHFADRNVQPVTEAISAEALKTLVLGAYSFTVVRIANRK